ncbi:MAG: hypothetical protein AAFN74_12950 [Myxococcota bacterium]
MQVLHVATHRLDASSVGALFAVPSSVIKLKYTQLHISGAFSLILTGLMFSMTAHGQGQRRRRPPPEAVDACVDRSEGDSCAFSHRDRQIEGTCRSMRGDGLVCVPQRPPGPPPAALDACLDLAVGDACQFLHGDHSIEGTCRHGPDGQGPLACAPARGPHDHPPR